MNPSHARELEAGYRRGLLEDTLPFWTRHAVDREQGGFLFCLDRSGSVVDTDKPLWLHGRFVWLLATLHQRVAPEEAWLELARHGLEFLDRHGFDEDGRMWFLVDRTGHPLRRRRYVFTECFASTAWGAWARATGEAGAAERALELFRLAREHLRTPGAIVPKVEPETRPQKSLATPMIELWCARELRGLGADGWLDEVVSDAAGEIAADFLHPELEACLETVGPGGEVLDHFEGRTLNPGHSLECGWFLLAEARRRGGDARLEETALAILEFSWQRGWDPEHGGILSFVGIDERPVQEYWHEQKFWWPQCEAVLATLLAHAVTGAEVWATRHTQAHDWAHAHHADPEHGEWFGYLRRDGSRASTLKGSHYKGPFHLPRMQLECMEIAAELAR